MNLDFTCEYVSGEPKTSAKSLEVEWVNHEDVLSRVQREAIRKRLRTMMEFSGEITYGAYFVDPNRIDLNYQ